jgi:hypothetical protein
MIVMNFLRVLRMRRHPPTSMSFATDYTWRLPNMVSAVIARAPDSCHR